MAFDYVSLAIDLGSDVQGVMSDSRQGGSRRCEAAVSV